jgi:restriction endonuclease S subunit
VSAVLTAQEPSAKYLVNLQPPLVRHFDLIAQAPGGVARLRELILTLAVQGKLVPQDPSETRVDISVIPAAINRLIGEGKVPRSRASGEDEQAAIFDELPSGWVAVTASNVFIPRSGNSKLIKGKLFSESAEHLYPGYSASGQDVWLPHFEYEGTAVILSAVGARCGKAFLAKGKWSAIANTHIIWPLLDLVLPEYSMLLLNNEDYWMRSGGAQPFVKVTETLRQQVFLPPLAEQSRIVTRSKN